MPPAARCYLVFASLLFINPSPSIAQTSAKSPLDYKAYNGWKSITAPQLSRDGKWVTYALTPQEGSAEVVVRSTTGPTEYKRARSSAPVITADSKFVLFTVRAPKTTTAGAKSRGMESAKPDDTTAAGFDQDEASDVAAKTPDGLGVLDLAPKKILITPRITRYKFPAESGKYVAILKAPPTKPEAKPDAKPDVKSPKKAEPGNDLILLDLATSEKITISEVTDFEWNRAGTRLIYSVASTDDAKTGVYVRELPAGTTSTLIKGKGTYKTLTFSQAGDKAAFLADHNETKQTPDAYSLFLWNAGEAAATPVVNDASAGIPKEMILPDYSQVRFSKDGSNLFFDFSPKALKALANVNPTIKKDVWTYKDQYLQSEQKIRSAADLKKTYLAVYHIAGKRFTPLATLDLPSVETTDGGKIAIGSSDIPYRISRSWDADYTDLYTIDMQTGARQKFLEKSRFGARLSTAGKYATYFSPEKHAWFALRLADNRLITLTAKARSRWTDDDSDLPEVHSPYGIAGWTADDGAVLIYDKFDIWQIDLKSLEARCVTAGAGRQTHTVYRYLHQDPEERAVPTSTPLMLTLFDQKTKASGAARITLNTTLPGSPVKPEILIKLDKTVNGIQKARKADAVLFTEETFGEYPDVWTADSSFKGAHKLTNANPQQAQYTWGKEELMHFKAADGRALDAVVIKPEGFDPNKKYPLMINIYERMSDRLHAYHRPAPGTSICISRYVSTGYVVLLPDILYKTGHPGQSALNCVIPAAQALIDQGFIDPTKVGIQGHSWGGYEITYMITRTDFFRCVEAGASVSDMVSAYGGIRWGTGISREGQYEHGQSRIGATPWERPDLYLENSAIFHVDQIHTPYLTIDNDADGAVPWYQGIEFITAMRRLGKEAYMFNYNGEDHNLRGRPNMKDWTVYMDEFFDHFLLDKPTPEWMEKGIPYLDRGKRDVKAMYGTAAAAD